MEAAKLYFPAVFSTVPPPAQRLLVFARLPEYGRVKTRLAKSIGDANALAAYETMLRDLQTSIGPRSPEMEIEILWAPSELANGDTLAKAFGDFPTAMQTGTSLGDRLSMAFAERFFFHATQKIVAIGVDDPSIPRALIESAFALLDSCEWVVGPAADGGYYLIGCRAAAFDPAIFEDVAWGTSSVLPATMGKIGLWQSSVALLPERWDIDEIEGWKRYVAQASWRAQQADETHSE
jgi:rSAM/selenodomain-associated transferase 1